jgi:hypothetical protein
MSLRQIKEEAVFVLSMGVFFFALLLGVVSCVLQQRDLWAFHAAGRRNSDAFFRARKASLAGARRVMDARLATLATDMTLKTIDDIEAASMEALRVYLTTATKPAYTLRWGWDVVRAALHHPYETLTWQDGDVK